MQVTSIGADGYIDSGTLDMRKAIACRIGLPVPPTLSPEKWPSAEWPSADSGVMNRDRGVSPDVHLPTLSEISGKTEIQEVSGDGGASRSGTRTPVSFTGQASAG